MSTVPAQTCCGQPAYNAGDEKMPRRSRGMSSPLFEGFDYVVAPSGSCAGMIKLHYPKLFRRTIRLGARARALAAKTHELFSFLVNVRGMNAVAAECRASALLSRFLFLAARDGREGRSRACC